MNDEQVGRIALAIREHTRATVAVILLASPKVSAPDEHAYVKATDALLAALSASSGGENDAASGATGADTALAQGAEVTAEGPSGVRKTEPNAQAATPPLSADAAADAYGLDEHETVTVRRDDLEWVVAVLSIHGECTTRWNRLRDVVSR